MKLLKLFCIPIIFILIACSPTSKHNSSHSSNDDFTPVPMLHANSITIEHNSSNDSRISIINPWKKDANLCSFTLSDSNESTPSNTITRPLKRVIVYSTVHANIIKELGHLSAVKGVCDPQYFTIPEIIEGVNNGSIVNVGSSASPNIERIIALSPDAVIVSPYQDSQFKDIEKLGITVVQCADYMETSPLGRAEWIKLFGELFGEQEKADSIYNNVLTEDNQLKQLATQSQHKPKVLSENIINGTWYVPGGDSYMAQLFADAGSTYAWSDVHTTGSIPLDMAQVLEKSHDADVWLIKSLESSFSYTKLKVQDALNSEFKAFKQKNIYFCNTERTTLYQDFPFHPELLLKEYIAIFNPQLLPDYNTQYYKPLLDE